MLNRGAGVFEDISHLFPEQAKPEGDHPIWWDVADFDGDGRDEIAVVTEARRELFIVTTVGGS